MTRSINAVFVFAVCAVLVTDPGAQGSSTDPAALTRERQRELVRFVRQDCGACHGLTLAGGLGPPLTVEALRERPRESLIATILNGRPGTAMPPWNRFLRDTEAQWVVDRLREGFPAE
jgi:cytochrome c55X